MTPRASKPIPALGATVYEVMEAWKKAAENPYARENVVGTVYPGGRFGFTHGSLVRLHVTPTATGNISTYAPATAADLDEVYEAIEKGWLQIERQRITGALGSWKPADAGACIAVLHQSTGQPLAAVSARN